LLCGYVRKVDAEYGRGTWSDLLIFFPREEKSLARALARLQEKGYVKRIELPRRRVFYELTEEGRKAFEELVGREKAAFFHFMREALRGSVLEGIIEKGGKLLREGRQTDAERVISSALAELALIPFIFAFSESGNEEEFRRKLKEYLKTSYPVLWTAGWALYQIASENPQFFEKLGKKLTKKIIKKV
jgi:DNA-binding MarR family transcriptional regulator